MNIIMTLRSDALPGSGEGLAGIIDADISQDEFGLPYIPAKRLKGVLRESAQELEAIGNVLQHSSACIFGSPGKKQGTDLKIANGYPTNYATMRQLLQHCTSSPLSSIFNREAVLSYYAYTRSQTSIDKFGVAHHGSLRTLRVLKKDLKFVFEVECPTAWEADLEKICQVTRNFGTSRTRGLGEISLKAEPSQRVQSASGITVDSGIQDTDRCELHVTLHNIGQLMVTVEVGKDQHTATYIPGSFLLGALAQAYTTHLPQANDFASIFLNGDVTFSNAYPIPDPKQTDFYPAPVSLVKKKDSKDAFDLAYPPDFQSVTQQNIPTKGSVGDFVHINGNDITPCTPETEVEYHHRRPDDKRLGHPEEGNGEFFQFEVLRTDQYFTTTITGPYAYLDQLRDVLNKQPVLYLGRSLTAQYGKCMVSGTLKKAALTTCSWKQNDTAVFTLTSDMTLRNQYGCFVPDPVLFRDELAAYLQVKPSTDLHIETAFVQSTRIGGFLRIWNMPKIQTPALAAGSVIVCKNNSQRDLTLTNIESCAFGDRIEEGYGRVKVGWHGNSRVTVKDNASGASYALPDQLSSAREFFRHILRNRLKNAIKDQAVEQARTLNKRVTNSFLGKLRLLIAEAQDVDRLLESLNQLRNPAVKQLKNLEDALFLQKPDERSGRYEWKTAKFREILMKKDDSHQIEALRNLLKKAGLEQIAADNKVFDWYQIYALHLLELLKLANRKEGQRGNG